MDPERTQPTPEGTGDSRVDEAVADLAGVDDLPLDDRPEALEAVHDRLREILGELGTPGAPGAPGTPGASGEPGRPGEQGELGRR
ncbi:MAG TPA: hypothetical protein VH136_09750 [Trebonia sp.]|nr:hypothetical protein [Trebonia sp.]